MLQVRQIKGIALLELNATVYIRKMLGGSQSHLVVASDGNVYVIKSVDNPQHRRVPLHEWFVTYIADRIGLSVAPRRIVNTTPSFINASPDYGAEWRESEYRRYSSGPCFGSRFLGGLLPGRTYDYLPESSLLKVVNKREFIGALVLDKWTCNSDGRQAVFILDQRRQNYKVYFIDHGYCFNEGRDKMEDAPLKGCYSRKLVYRAVRGWKDFEPWLEGVRVLDSSELWKGLQGTPREWYDSNKVVLEGLIEILDRRRRRIPELIDSLRSAKPDVFPMWS